jgi:catechol 2,3-dioxygenase-like lactoylglutathione lyase family enzyme
VPAGISFDHVGLVVDDLETTAEFFTSLGFTRHDLGTATGTWVDRVVGLEGTEEEIVRQKSERGMSTRRNPMGTLRSAYQVAVRGFVHDRR